jgi:uncharacterized membrane protein
MPGKLPLFLGLALLLGACGQKAGKACPADVQNACVDSSLTYDAGIGAIFDTRCAPCHFPLGVEDSVLLNSHAQVLKARMSVGSQLVTCSMPPEGSPQLSETERQQILDWLSCGAP